jgi:hypothetical protein
MKFGLGENEIHSIYIYTQGGSNMTGTDLCVNSV